MRGSEGVITLMLTGSGWNARFTGAAAEIVQAAFGTDTIPTAFTRHAPASKVQREIAARWKGCVVNVEPAQ